MQIAEYRPEHLDDLVDALVAVRAQGPYPHPLDTDADANALRAWFLDLDEHGEPNQRTYARMVALVDGVACGYVQTVPPHDYVTGRIAAQSMAEVSRLFVHPEFSKHGAGRLLLKYAVQRCHKSGLTPVLAVVSTSEAAIRLYERVGWMTATIFEGIHGTNRLMVGPPPAVMPPRTPSSRGVAGSRLTKTTANLY